MPYLEDYRFIFHKFSLHRTKVLIFLTATSLNENLNIKVKEKAETI
jgi:hypothetical protein